MKLKINNRIGYAHYSRAKFNTLNWNDPDIIIYREELNNILQEGGFSTYNDQIIYPINGEVHFSNLITEESFSIITPK